MATPEEIREAAAERMLSGVEERQIADRRTRYVSPEKLLVAAELLASQTSSNGPFIRVGFKSRAI